MRLFRPAMILLSFGLPAAAQEPSGAPRSVTQSAERAVSDDSADVLTARWQAALRKDSTDRSAILGLATISRMTYDFPAAERLLRRLLAGSSSVSDSWALQAQLGLYRVAAGQGDHRRADSLLELSLVDARRLGDRGAEMEALVGLSGIRGGLAEGIAVLDTLRALLPPGDRWERAEYLCRLGLFRGIGGDSAALAGIREGIGVARRAGERRLTGHCLEAYALVHSLQGHADSVLPIMDRAETLLRATHDHSSLARLESRRSDELQVRGRLGEAKVALGQVLAEAAVSRNRHRAAVAYGGLGMLALRVGDLPTAATLFQRAEALSDSLGQIEGAMIARQNRGEVMAAAGDLEGARKAFEGTLKEADREGFFEDAVVARQRLARIAIRRGDWDEAARQLAAADVAARARGLGDVRDALDYDRGKLALGRNQLSSAQRLFAGLLARTAPEDHLVRHAARVQLAQVWARQGNLSRAERELVGAGRELETWRESLGDDELRSFAFAATVLGEYDPQAPVAGVLAALAEGGRVEAAFALAEQRRARALTDRLTQAEALREGDEAPAPPVYRAAAATAAEIAGALPDDRTALLEYVAGSEGVPTTVFIATRAGVQARLLPPADSLAAPIRRFVALLEQGLPAEGLASRLGAVLLAPAAEVLPAEVTRLLVVPDGPLHRVPFDALRLPDGRAAVERWAVGLAPSAALAARLWRPREPDTVAAGDEPRLLALGDPAFPGEREAASTREAEIYRSAFAANGGLPRLAASGEEAREVGRYARGRAEVRLRGEASEEWLKTTPLLDFRVIHLATHALVDESSLARTALALAPGKREDGFLSPADLAALRLRADVVVLSACRTAGGVAVAGEGVQGLTTPLLAAGARAVVATQWRIGDRSTVPLVKDVYAGLARNLTVVEALREAKLAAIRRGVGPREWAGFTVVGDPLTRVAVRAPSPRPGWTVAAGLAAVLAVVAGYLVLRGKRRRATAA